MNTPTIAEKAVRLASYTSQLNGGPALELSDLGADRNPPDGQDEESRLSARYKVAEDFDEHLATDDGFLAEMMVDAISERQWRHISLLIDSGDGQQLLSLMKTLRDTEHDSRLAKLLEDE